MRILLSIFWGTTVLAATPNNIGDFNGQLFTGPSVVQRVQIQGGALSECTQNSGSLSEIYKCKLSEAAIVVTHADRSSDTYTFDTAAVLIPKETETRHYYLKGTRRIDIGGQEVTQEIGATINLKDAEPNRASGYLELKLSGIRSWFDTYR